MAAVFARNQVQIKKTGTSVTVPDNPKAKLMYYFNCICTCVDADGDPKIRRLGDYSNYYSLSKEEEAKLIVLCVALSPDKLIGSILFPAKDTELDGFNNQFFEVSAVSTKLVVAQSILIGGQQKRVRKIMMFKKSWIETNYLKPLLSYRPQTPALPSSQPQIVLRLRPAPQQNRPSPSPQPQITPATPAPAPPPAPPSSQPQIVLRIRPAPQQNRPSPSPQPQITPVAPPPTTPPAEAQQSRAQNRAAVPDNPRAKLMYYFNSICFCLEPDGDPMTARLRDYKNHSRLSDEEFRQLLSRCLALGPNELTGKIFFPKENLQSFQNEFHDVNAVKSILGASEYLTVGGQRRRVQKIMMFKKQWMDTYYHKPIRPFTSHSNSSCCTLL